MTAAEDLGIRCGTAIIQHPESERFLVAQRKLDNTRSPGMWEFPGGKQDPEDENTRVTMVREVKEETGLVVVQSNFLACFRWRFTNGEVGSIWFYYVPVWTGTPESHQSEQLSWMTVEQIEAESNFLASGKTALPVLSNYLTTLPRS